MSCSLKPSGPRQQGPTNADSWSTTLQLRSPQSFASSIEPFLYEVTERVIESLHKTAHARYAEAKEAATASGKSQEQPDQNLWSREESSPNKEKLTPQQQMERASFLANLTAQLVPDEKMGGRSSVAVAVEGQPADEDRMPNPHLPAIRSIIRGYLVDFLRQTEEQIVPCNIVGGKLDTSVQRAYWEKQPPDKFWSAAGSGVFHSAFSYNKLYEVAAARRSVAWSALANIVKTSAEKFKEMHLQTFPGIEPQASVLNDHNKVLEIAIRHEPVRRPGLNRAS